MTYQGAVGFLARSGVWRIEDALTPQAQFPNARAQDGGPGSVTAPAMMQQGQDLQNSFLL